MRGRGGFSFPFQRKGKAGEQLSTLKLDNAVGAGGDTLRKPRALSQKQTSDVLVCKYRTYVHLGLVVGKHGKVAGVGIHVHTTYVAMYNKVSN